MIDPDAILEADPEAVGAMARAAALILDGHDDGRDAYVACRLAAPAIMARHPGLADDPLALALVMLRHAASTALVVLPVPRMD